MCGRYVRSSDKWRIAEAFRVKGDVSGIAMAPANYNVAPSTFQPVIRENREDGTRELVAMRWGLIPFFTKDISNVNSPPSMREPRPSRRRRRGGSHSGSAGVCCRQAITTSGKSWTPRPNSRTPSAFRADRFCLRRPVGRLEGRGRALAPVIQHRDHDGKRTGVGCPYPYAVHPPQPRL